MQCRFFFAVFINCQCFVCAVIFHRVFCLLVVQLLLRFCFFRKNFQYAVARCVGYFSTTFCTEMQCRFFLCSFHQFSMFCLCSNLSPCNFCLFVVPLHLRFCFFRKNFKYAVAMCVGYFSTTFLCRNAMSVFLCSFHQLSMFCLCSNLSPCILSVGCAVAPAILFFTEVLCFCM